MVQNTKSSPGGVQLNDLNVLDMLRFEVKISLTPMTDNSTDAQSSMQRQIKFLHVSVEAQKRGLHRIAKL